MFVRTWLSSASIWDLKPVHLEPMPLKLLSLNIEGDNHFDRIFPFLATEQPDVLCLQEVFEVDIPLFEEKTGMKATFLPQWVVNKDNPYRLNPKGKQGVALLTAFPQSPIAATYYFGDGVNLPEVSEVTPDQVQRAVIVSDISKDGKTYRVATTHFTWSPGGSVTDIQRQHLQSLLSVIQPLGEIILCGDFNAPRGKEIFDTLATLYTDNIPSNIQTTMDQNLHRVPGLMFVVDVLFTSPTYQVQNAQVIDGVSDHCAILATIV